MRLNRKSGVPVALANRSERFTGHLNETFFDRRSELQLITVDDDLRFGFTKKSPIDFERMVREKVA